ncbi:galactokinase (plasmid) [Deinococcus metallilatus]|uniref:Galactokinase n=1 Tax=Deinococcus metallilatus TaxID=1211322 RepID=A0AAJ5F7N5_9DEIO|nr:galactokinase [Deinococcus metallilatus]MBB5293248.1 galactokinase [Deinococcus metallilatus]QBY07034.1 galactokinase [Deinococcus metallilatus]RXJ18045.1 galactokinase [Deinococcus metallilatus]TLK31981.1 galactokinase [Deinococcus metallilatus]GMA15529.1 galactokinase [Deinococcus metallilatus]
MPASSPSFADVFGRPPEAQAQAPGRVNLLGEHTDYQGGFVLPSAIPQHTVVALARNGGDTHHLYSLNYRERLDVPAGETGTGFAPYVTGCCALTGVTDALDVWISSDVPSGGLSSSAALEIATLRALRTLYDLPLTDVDLALIGQRVEHEFVGVRSGIMDQMASSLADTRHMLFLDTRTLERQKLPLPAGGEVVVLDSGVPRRLAGSGYNTRRSEVEEAARLLGVSELRDVPDVAALASLPDLLLRRARHVVSENARVLLALHAPAPLFGELMNASHASLRSDYEVTVPRVDELVALLQAHPDVYGARMTGAGFGGAVVALARIGTAGQVARDVLAQYGPEGQQVVPPPHLESESAKSSGLTRNSGAEGRGN